MRININGSIDITDITSHLYKDIGEFPSTEACERAMSYILEKELCGGMSHHPSSLIAREHEEPRHGILDPHLQATETKRKGNVDTS